MKTHVFLNIKLFMEFSRRLVCQLILFLVILYSDFIILFLCHYYRNERCSIKKYLHFFNQITNFFFWDFMLDLYLMVHRRILMMKNVYLICHLKRPNYFTYFQVKLYFEYLKQDSIKEFFFLLYSKL